MPVTISSHMKVIALSLLLATATTGVQAQQPLDPAFLQKAIAALQTQRNNALDAAASAEARAGQLADEVAKLQARITELEKQAKAPEAGK